MTIASDHRPPSSCNVSEDIGAAVVSSGPAALSRSLRSWFLASWLGRHPEVWVGLVLFATSHLFISTFATFARWHFHAKYYRQADFCGWDCGWFRSVVDEGYDLVPHRQENGTKANWSFFPLFPLSAVPLKWLRMRTTRTALVYASKFELYAAIVCVLLMLRSQLRDLSEYFIAGALVAFNPYIVSAHAGYSEPLYFAFAALAFYLLDQERWIRSGLAAALLSATRLVGCVFSLAYLVACVQKLGLRRLWRERNVSVLLGLLLCPLGLAVYMLYLYHHVGDALAPVHIQLGWNRVPTNPLHVIVQGLHHEGWPRMWVLIALAGLAAAAWLMKKRRTDLGVYLAAAILIPLSADLTGFPRYFWWQPPVLYAIFCLLKRHRSWSIVYFAFSGGMASYVIVLWFSGSNVVT